MVKTLQFSSLKIFVDDKVTVGSLLPVLTYLTLPYHFLLFDHIKMLLSMIGDQSDQFKLNCADDMRSDGPSGSKSEHEKKATANSSIPVGINTEEKNMCLSR